MNRRALGWICVALAGAALALAYVFASPGSEVRSPTLVKPAEAEADVPELSSVEQGDSVATTAQRSKLPSSGAESGPTNSPPPTGTARVIGSFVGPSGEPVPDVQVFATYLPDRVLATGDEQGNVDFAVPPPPFDPTTTANLYFIAEGYRSYTLRAELTADSEFRLGRIVLAYGAKIVGTVVDEEGDPVEDALVRHVAAGAPPNGRTQVSRETRSDERGQFKFNGVPPGDRLVTARSGLLEATSGSIRVRAGDTVEVELSLSVPRDALEIRVVGPDQLPLPKASVEYEYQPADPEERAFLRSMESSLRRGYATDEDGKITLRFGEAQDIRIRGLDPRGRFAPSEYVSIRPEQLGPHGMRSLQITLRKGKRLVIALKDVNDAPVPWGHVGLQGGSSLLETREDGRAELAAPEGTFYVDAVAPGFQRETFGPFEPTDIEGHLELVLQKGHTFSGRVLHRGRVIQGAKLGLHVVRGPHLSGSVAPLDSPFTIIGHVGPEVGDATTDSRGRFQISLHQAARYAVRVTAEGFASQVLGPWNLSPFEDPSFDLPLEDAGSLGGEVLGGLPEIGNEVLIAISDGWGYVRTAPIQADGSYHFEDVPVGPWQVRAVLPPVASFERLERGERVKMEATPRYDTFIKPGSPTRFDVDLDEAFASVLIGRLDMAESEGAFVLLSRLAPDWSELASARVDASGHFRLVTSHTGSATMTIHTESVRIQDSFDLDGFRSWNARVETGTLELFGTSKPGSKGWVRVETTLMNGAVASTTVPVQVSGENATPYPLRVPAGHCRIFIEDSPENSSVPTAELTIAPGEVVPFKVE